jgi:hypothetical protein
LSDKLIVFDYSGTLSLDAVAFSCPDNLIRHLQKSGLFALGIDNAEIFWEIVNSTWTKGSTTQSGYKAVLEERIAELFPQKAVSNRAEISRSAEKFVDAYLDHSSIDGHWRFVLQKLFLEKPATIIIATDHYAEATKAIINHLEKWNIQAEALKSDLVQPYNRRITRREGGGDEAYCAYVKEGNDETGNGKFIVANSADMGVYKCSKRFWQIVKYYLKQNFNKILLIDDFGRNEQPDDAYADDVKIFERRQLTEKILHNLFAADVQSFFFSLQQKQTRAVIAETAAIIDRFLFGK